MGIFDGDEREPQGLESQLTVKQICHKNLICPTVLSVELSVFSTVLSILVSIYYMYKYVLKYFSTILRDSNVVDNH